MPSCCCSAFARTICRGLPPEVVGAGMHGACLATAWRGGGRWLGAALFVLCSLTPVAQALTPDGTLKELKHTAWTAKEGIPNSPFMAMAQSQDGYLWFGTAVGLFRFDGLRFERYELPPDPKRTSRSVKMLFGPVTGGLWIGFTYGGAAFLKDGRVEYVAEGDGLTPGSVSSFAQDDDGTVWAATTGGLARRVAGRWQRMAAQVDFPASDVQSLSIDAEGTVWAATLRAVFFLPAGQDVFRMAPVLSKGRPSLAISADGTVWLHDDLGIKIVHRGARPRGAVRSAPGAMVFDRDGSLWTVHFNDSWVNRAADPERLAAKGAIRSADMPDSFSQKDGLSSNTATMMLEDREGNIWVSTTQGLDRFSERNVVAWRPPPMGRFSPVLAFAAGLAPARGGGLWIAHYGQLTHVDRDGRTRIDPELGPNSCVVALADGSLWVGGRGALWHEVAGRFIRSDLPSETTGFDVQAIAAERNGALWASVVRQGTYRLDGGVWTRFGGLAALPQLPAITLSTDRTGGLWFGYTESRAALLDAGQIRLFSAKDGLAVGNVTAIHGRRSATWVGGESGLARFDGDRFQPVHPDEDHAFDGLGGIVEAADGGLWLNGSSGIVHVSAAELQRSIGDPGYRVRTEVYGVADGVIGSGTRLRPLPSAIEGSDGKIWFTTSSGFYSIDPARLKRNPVAPAVTIQGVSADGTQQVVAPQVQLPARTAALQVAYAGISLTSAERVRYRYKLDGVDADWQPGGAGRVASYVRLAPGTYRFHVTAANNDGVWNETGASIDLTMPHAFTQTLGFYALCLAGGVGLVLLTVHLRVRQVASRLRRRLEVRMAERERIARELHDTLLQSVTALALHVRAAANQIPAGSAVRDRLELALSRADGVVVEGRDRVAELRLHQGRAISLVDALASACKELSEAFPGPSVDMQHSGGERAVNALVGQETDRIAREALTNALRHAGARRITVLLHFDRDAVHLRVADDGHGFVEDGGAGTGRPGHFGLAGMRERAAHIGGDLRIRSDPQGTAVELTVPATGAYRPRRRRTWFSW